MADSKDRKIKVHLISGTHWDREWRYTLQQSKLRLMRLLDGLLETLETAPRYTCFHLDGGAVVLEDYFSVRPEMQEKVCRHIRDGRIKLVNWYTLPDTFLVTGEALIRNLMLGRRLASRYGGAMRTGYTATSYGQNSQLPQIYRGFGIATALFYRGTNKHQQDPIFRWRAKDGSEIHVIRCFDEVTRTNWFFYVHQPLVLGKPPRDLTYTYAAADQPVHMADAECYEMDFQMMQEDPAFLDDEQSVRQAMGYLKRQAGPQAIGPHLLALDMEDNAKPYAPLPRMLDRINAVCDDVEVVQEDIDRYVDTILAEIEGKDLQVLSGEMRCTQIEPGFNGLYGMTQSSRVRLKLLNEQAETELACLAEPLAAVAAMRGWEYPRSLLDIAWKNLLENHAHDSICGAAVDPAHEDMLTRFRAATHVAQEVARRSCEQLWKSMDFSAFQEGDIPLTVFNTTLQRREGVVEAVVDLPKAGGSTHAFDACFDVGADTGQPRPSRPSYACFDVVNSAGEMLPYEVLSRQAVEVRIERELDTAVSFPADRVRLLIPVEVDSLGHRTYAVRPRWPQYVTAPAPTGPRGLIAAPGGVLENEHLRARINANGTFCLVDKATGRTMEDLHHFVDSGSIGSAHVDRRPMRDFAVTSLGTAATITLVENSPLRATYRVDLAMSVPAAAAQDGSERLTERVDLPISSWITLARGARRVEIRTRLDNRARDHRLQVLFPSGVASDSVDVESVFAVDRRCLLWKDTGDNHEKHHPFQPMQNFVDISDGQAGLAILNKGIREYEAMDDDRRTLALTLLRTHRAYMVSYSNMSTAERGRYTGLHSLGEHEYRYAVCPHAGDWQAGGVLCEAWDFKVPMRIIQGVVKPGDVPPDASGVSFDNANVMLSGFCQSEDSAAYILRVWNPLESEIDTQMRTTLPLAAIAKVRMDESQQAAALPGGKGQWTLKLRGGEIVTLRLSPEVR